MSVTLCNSLGNLEEQELYEYAIYIFLSSLLHCITILLIGYFYNLLIESILFYFSFVLIRKFAGGYHARTHIRCYVSSTISAIVIIAIIKLLILLQEIIYIHLAIIGLSNVCILVIVSMVPLESDNKPLSSNEKYYYRIIAIIMTFIIYFLFIGSEVLKMYNISIALSSGIFVSSFVLVIRKIQTI